MLALPVTVMLAGGLIVLAAMLHEVLVAHDVARAAARVAATTTDDHRVATEVERNLPASLSLQVVEIAPAGRSPGQLITVRISVMRELAGTQWSFDAIGRSVAEPVVAWD